MIKVVVDDESRRETADKQAIIVVGAIQSFRHSPTTGHLQITKENNWNSIGPCWVSRLVFSTVLFLQIIDYSTDDVFLPRGKSPE